MLEAAVVEDWQWQNSLELICLWFQKFHLVPLQLQSVDQKRGSLRVKFDFSKELQ